VISADSIFVGKDVTDAKEYGDVRIGPGDILLKGKSTKIKNCTFVPIGTILKVEH
jgi:hypothetical protein